MVGASVVYFGAAAFLMEFSCPLPWRYLARRAASQRQDTLAGQTTKANGFCPMLYLTLQTSKGCKLLV